MSCKNLLRKMVLPMLLLISQLTFAQDKTVTGKVTDAKDGSPVVGASVVVTGTRKGTTTKNDGTFTITVGADAKSLTITSIGFGKMDVSIDGKTSVDVALSSTNSNLNEVVVVGYGTRRVKDATGSVAALSTKDFNKGVIATPEQLIQGRTPGVSITPSSGEPGAAATINIR
ncbi:MAG: carboxypeptidase-like regulatory domain-containing protein, partial [Bacteroidetes bacterium]|nr:carboxypeptidase-like regulatory domain-containing protein [Bacteroidota bacterium]